jgi:hypothetical protein
MDANLARARENPNGAYVRRWAKAADQVAVAAAVVAAADVAAVVEEEKYFTLTDLYKRDAKLSAVGRSYPFSWGLVNFRI